MGDLVVYAPEKISGVALCELLKRRRFTPKYFQTPEELLGNIRFGLASIIILDLSSMPELTEELKEILKIGEEDEVPIIMLTPYALNEEELSPFHERGYYIMEKPISLDDLVLLIQKLASYCP